MMLHSNGLRSLPQLHVNDKVRPLQGHGKDCFLAKVHQGYTGSTTNLLAVRR